MRSIWSGSISFGLVTIPVKLYPMIVADPLRLNFLRGDDLCPIAYKKICRETGEEVSKEDIVRGYEYQKGDYVVLDEKDFEKADIEKNYAIVIEDFVKAEEVDFQYADKPYYLEPDKKTQSVYALFREALKKSGLAGIGKFVLRTKEHLVMLRVQGEILTLNTLRFQSEFRDASGLAVPGKTKIPKNQLDLALELIEKLSGPFQPEKYKDTYTETLLQIVEEKRKGKEPKSRGERKPRAVAPDLVARLKESLAMAGK